METSVRIFNSTNLSRNLPRPGLIRPCLKLQSKYSSHIFLNATRNPNLSLLATGLLRNSCDNRLHSNLATSARIRPASFSVSRSSPCQPNSNSLRFLLSLSASHIFNSRVSEERLDRDVPDPKERFLEWNRVLGIDNGGDLGLLGDRGPVLTVVLLGWLGAKVKHLKRYEELYTSRGIHAVTFVIPVRDVLWFDLGRRAEKRISVLTGELVSWLSETEEDGRERNLLFHTFSNTGWFAYGAILENLQCRGDFMDKIKGCVIDSGGDPEVNPQVWAAGFFAALLKKRSSLTSPSAEDAEGHESQIDKNMSEVQENKPFLIETLLLSVLEKFFSVVLKWPDVRWRLNKVISTLSKNQPPCPQLYLYSTADKIIPFRSVEVFIQDQKMRGRKVWAYNFGSSPHVDHYRSFPRKYSAELHRFLKVCLTKVGQR